MPLSKYVYSRILFFMLLSFCLVHGQKDLNERLIQVNSPQLNSIEILLSQEVELLVEQHDLPFVKIIDQHGGEYKNAVILTYSMTGETIKIEDQIAPNFNFPQDKLSAHKVLDDKLKLLLPKQINRLFIKGQNVFLTVNTGGIDIEAHLESGFCHLNIADGDVNAVCVYADIQLTLPQKTIIKDKQTEIIDFRYKNHMVHLESAYGTITIGDK